MSADLETSPEHQYVLGQFRPTFPALLETFAHANAEVLAGRAFEVDLVYGPHKRQRYDLCISSGETRAVVLYFHAGYWQSRDKSQFRFLAQTLCARGFTVALVNYPLCPDVKLDVLTGMVGDVIPAVQARLSSLSKEVPWIACGHSAGAHLAVEIALSQQLTPPNHPRLKGVLGVSGIYELSPLLHTTLNDKLEMDVSSAIAGSPIRRVYGGLPNATFVVGGLETPAFREQSAKMASVWRQAGNSASYLELPEQDHFSILWGQELADLLAGLVSQE